MSISFSSWGRPSRSIIWNAFLAAFARPWLLKYILAFSELETISCSLDFHGSSCSRVYR